jgi:hypothetical protein
MLDHQSRAQSADQENNDRFGKCIHAKNTDVCKCILDKPAWYGKCHAGNLAKIQREVKVEQQEQIDVSQSLDLAKKHRLRQENDRDNKEKSDEFHCVCACCV